MHNVRKAIGDKVILDNVTLSFYPGAKIGVVGPNGAGKSTLLKIMAGLEKRQQRRRHPRPRAPPSASCMQEPPLTEDKTVLENVEEAVAEIKAHARPLQRDRRGDGRPGRRLRRAAGRDGRPADRARPPPTPGTSTRQLEQAMDALRCPPRRRAGRHPLRWRAAPRRAVQAAAAAARPAAARRAHQPPRRRDACSWLEGHLADLPGRRPRRHPRPVLPRQRRRSGSCELDRGQLHPYEGNYSTYLETKRERLQIEGKKDAKRAKILERRARVGALQRQGPAGQEQGPPGPLRGDGRRGRAEPQARLRRDQHPAGPAAGRRRARGQQPRQGLRRPRADRRPVASRCRAPASSASSAPTASARPRCSR